MFQMKYLFEKALMLNIATGTPIVLTLDSIGMRFGIMATIMGMLNQLLWTVILRHYEKWKKTRA